MEGEGFNWISINKHLSSPPDLEIGVELDAWRVAVLPVPFGPRGEVGGEWWTTLPFCYARWEFLVVLRRTLELFNNGLLTSSFLLDKGVAPSPGAAAGTHGDAYLEDHLDAGVLASSGPSGNVPGGIGSVCVSRSPWACLVTWSLFGHFAYVAR